MVTNYQNENINLENIREVLKNIVEIISKPPKYILDKLKSNSTDVKYQKITTQPDRDIFLELNTLMDSIADLLKKNNLFYNEYFDFCEIQDMINDILNRDPSLIKKSDLVFILEIIDLFSDLINYKIDLIEDNEFDEKEFESTYSLYLTNFNKSKIYFYENICDETLDDDLFMEYTNIIME